MPAQVNATVVALVVGIALPMLSVRQSAAQAHGEDVPEELRRPFTRAMFTDTNAGYVYDVGGRTVIIATSDGGASWRLVMDSLVSESRRASRAVFFLDGNTFWVLHHDGTLDLTRDGGRTFVEQAVRELDLSGRPVRLMCGGVFFRSPSDGWAACGENLLHTLDGSVSWQRATVARGKAFYRVWFFNEHEGMAVGNGVVRTDDGGQTWKAVSGAPAQLDELSCSRDGFCVASTGTSGPPLFVTADHGRTWRDLKVPLKPDQQDDLMGFQAVSANFVVAVGRDNGERIQDFDERIAAGGAAPPVRGLILKWDGTTWTRITHAQPQDFAGVFFGDANNGWFPDFENTIYKTTDGGQTVTFVPDYFRQIAALTPSPTPFVVPTPTP